MITSSSKRRVKDLAGFGARLIPVFATAIWCPNWRNDHNRKTSGGMQLARSRSFRRTWRSGASMISPISPTTSITSARFTFATGSRSLVTTARTPFRGEGGGGSRKETSEFRSTAPPCVFLTRARDNGADVGWSVNPERSFVTQKLSSMRRSVHQSASSPPSRCGSTARCGYYACGSSIWQLTFTWRLVLKTRTLMSRFEGQHRYWVKSWKNTTLRCTAVPRPEIPVRKNVLGEFEWRSNAGTKRRVERGFSRLLEVFIFLLVLRQFKENNSWLTTRLQELFQRKF